MKEHGILFTDEMVRAILDRRKTQTRRLVKLREFGPSTTPGYDWTFRDRRALWNDVSTAGLLARCPYGAPGDLWVRETWGQADSNHDEWSFHRGKAREGLPVLYRADECWRDEPDDAYWRPSILMPRWACRLVLEVTDVRVERLQDITEEDARAEGMHWRDAGPDKWGNPLPGWSWRSPHPVDMDPEKGWEHCLGTARFCFGNLWNSVTPSGARWGDRPWVWVISFRRVE